MDSRKGKKNKRWIKQTKAQGNEHVILGQQSEATQREPELYCTKIDHNKRENPIFWCTDEGIYTFPKIGAIPMITEAKAERTCWDESDDSSYEKECALVKVTKIIKDYLIINTWMY